MTKQISASISPADFAEILDLLRQVPFANKHQVTVAALRLGIRAFRADPKRLLDELTLMRRDKDLRHPG